MARISATADLFCEEDLVLPDKFRPYTPPGSKPIRIPTRIKAFRPMHEDSPVTKDIFTRFFVNTRRAAAQREGLDPDVLAPLPSFPNNPLPDGDPAAHSDIMGPDDVFVVDGDTIRYLNLMENPAQEGTYIPMDHRDIPIVHDDGSDIITDADGYELPPKETWWRKLTKKAGNTDKAAGSKENLVVYTKDGIPLGDFDVVAPGHAPSDGKSARGTRALAVASAALGSMCVLGLIGGVLVGRSAVPAQGQITQAEATNYHLNKFPVEAGVAFAKHYLTTCLTHPQYKEDTEKRAKLMKGMQAPGVPEDCGWVKGGAVTAPTTVSFNGYVEERPEYTDGKVAYLGFFVTMQDGRHFTATVPVWAGENEQKRPAYSIVGTVGMSAATAMAANPNMTFNLPMDRAIASTLTPVLTSYFTAWGEGNEQAMNAVLSNDAKGEARAGMGGSLTQPKITSTIVYPDRAPDVINGQNATWNYVDGDSLVAMVNLDWHIKDDAGGHTQPAGYRVSMVYRAGKWEVTGLQSGVVVANGTSTGESAGGSKKAPTNLGDAAQTSGGFGTLEEAGQVPPPAPDQKKKP